MHLNITDQALELIRHKGGRIAIDFISAIG